MEAPLIIIVDRYISFLEIMADILDDEGYQAIGVQEATSAFDIIKARMPTLVLLELTMSNLEAGLMILTRMRLEPQTAHIPIIIASTTTDLTQRNEQYLRSQGCDIFIKPFGLDALLTMVAKYAPLTHV